MPRIDGGSFRVGDGKSDAGQAFLGLISIYNTKTSAVRPSTGSSVNLDIGCGSHVPFRFNRVNGIRYI